MINNIKFKSVGILGFGAYLPFARIKNRLIAQAWKKGAAVFKGLGVEQKAVADVDQDCLTMAVEASKIALKRAGIKPGEIGLVLVGSESHPYAVKPTGTILANILGMGNEYFCADLQFACKAATTGLQMAAGIIEAGMVDYALVIGSDKAQSRPGDALELTAAAGAASLILGRLKKAAFKLVSTYSFNSDTPDFWRRQTQIYPEHTGRFTGEPGYFFHLQTCCQQFLKKINKKPSFFDQVIFHMPNSKFPLKAAKNLGFQPAQLKQGFLVPQIGNPYSASSLLGLTAVLEKSKGRENILLVSYGSGAGSDAFWFKTHNMAKLKKVQKKSITINQYLMKNKKINYSQYLHKMEILK